MGKKIDREEPKKECPSCGLGVSLEANMCEFCGWDFEEEDEWILQIEKLERELMLEKKRFEPGTVDHKIEATLRNPAVEKAEAARAAGPAPKPFEPEVQPVIAQTAVDLIEPEVTMPERQHAAAPPQPVFEVEEAPKVRKVRSVKAAPQPAPQAQPAPVPRPSAVEQAQGAPKVRRVKMPAQKPPEPTPEQTPPKKIRAIRKVKG